MRWEKINCLVETLQRSSQEATVKEYEHVLCYGSKKAMNGGDP